jgi:oxalate decarboxylase
MSEDAAGFCSRRSFIGSTSVALTVLAAARASAAPAPDAASASDPGPDNAAISGSNPNVFVPPRTDHGEVQSFWQSFSAMHRRIQEGGWARQLNVKDFPISTEIAGVNMRLTAGGIRELHWHAAAEWAIMLNGRCRLTAIDDEGRSFVQDVGEGDLWYFPSGTPHSLQGLGPDGCEFLLVFDDGKFSEGETTLISDWVRHTPHEVLAKNWGVPLSALEPLDRLPDEGHWIFQAPVPPALEQDRAAAAGARLRSPVRMDFPTLSTTPDVQNASGSVHIIDSRKFPISATIAAAYVVVKPGCMRELHWHQHADEWLYVIRGKGRMTLFDNAARARTADFAPGDVGYVPKTLGHYMENTGEHDLVFIETFKSARYSDLSLNDWMTHTPPELIFQHLGTSPETLRAIPREKAVVLPK